jgi:hypothetical protein
MRPSAHTPAHRTAQRAELPPLTWPAPLDALPPLGITKAPESPSWQETMPMPMAAEPELFDAERGSAFQESLGGLQVRELIGDRLFERLFGNRP